jgi:hypothetical protein
MNNARSLLFLLLAPVLAALLVVPVALAHIAAHVLIDLMRRNNRLRSTHPSPNRLWLYCVPRGRGPADRRISG